MRSPSSDPSSGKAGLDRRDPSLVVAVVAGLLGVGALIVDFALDGVSFLVVAAMVALLAGIALVVAIKSRREPPQVEVKTIAMHTPEQNALSRARIGLFERDIVANTFTCTPEVTRLLGRQNGEPPATIEQFQTTIHADDRVTFTNALRASLRDGTSFDVDFRVVRPDGTVRWLNCRTYIERGDDRAPRTLTGTLTDVTERVDIRHRLAASESLYRKVAENIPGVIYQLVRYPDERLELQFVSAGITDIFGLPREEFYKDAALISRSVHPDDAERAKALTESSTRDLSVFDWTGRIVRPDGGVRWVHAVIQPEKRDDGAIVWDGIMLDVTAAKSAESELAETKDRLAHLLKASPVVIYSCQAASPYPVTYVSENAEELFGIASDECTINPACWQERVHSDDRGRVNHALETASRSGQADIEYRVRSGSGEYRWVRDEMRHVAESGGSTIVGTVIDVTDRRLAQDALRQSESRFAAMSEASPLGVFMTDPAGALVYANARLADITGVAQSALIGGTLLQLVSPDDADRAEETLLRAIADGTDASIQCRMMTPDHEMIWASIKTAPVLDRGDLIGFVGTVEDITERHELEMQGEQSRIEAQRTSQAKTAFISRISHELRTPLHAILGFAQLLEMTKLDEDQRQSVENIMQSGAHLRSLIQDLLDIARAESGQLSVQMSTVSLRPVVEEAVQTLAPMAEQKAVSVDVKMGVDDHVSVLADRQRLKQLVVNVLSNAIKYNQREGSVVVACEIRPNGYATLSVRDTGPGIGPEKVERLFTPFDRLGLEASDIEGAGLGLTLTKRLVEAMGGTLEVESDERIGTTVSISLRYAGASQAPQALVDIGERRPVRTARRRKVLLIEDNASNIRLMESVFLNRPNYDLMVERSGKSGIQSALEGGPDLILLDLALPDMMGMKLLESIKAERSLADTDVIVISAAEERQLEKARQKGAAACLTKPLDVVELLRTVDAVLGAVKQ